VFGLVSAANAGTLVTTKLIDASNMSGATAPVKALLRIPAEDVPDFCTGDLYIHITNFTFIGGSPPGQFISVKIVQTNLNNEPGVNLDVTGNGLHINMGSGLYLSAPSDGWRQVNNGPIGNLCDLQDINSAEDILKIVINESAWVNASIDTSTGADDVVIEIKLNRIECEEEHNPDNLFVLEKNQPPIADANGPITGNEGSPLTFDGLGSYDPDGIILKYKWDFGDGASATDTLTPIHAYGDNGTYTVTLTMTDNDKGVGADTLTIDVNNVAPTVNIDFVDQPNQQFILPIVHTLAFTGSFSDPGWLDTHASTWDFDDGSSNPGFLTEENDAPDATGTSTATHSYSAPGMYNVRLTVTDDDGEVESDTMSITIVTAQDAVGIINESIQDLPANAFKNKPDKRKNAFSKKIAEVNELIDAGQYQKVINKLQEDIRAKTDGSMGGKPKDDWITDPEVQEEICTMIDDLIAYLETLL